MVDGDAALDKKLRAKGFWMQACHTVWRGTTDQVQRGKTGFLRQKKERVRQSRGVSAFPDRKKKKVQRVVRGEKK